MIIIITYNFVHWRLGNNYRARCAISHAVIFNIHSCVCLMFTRVLVLTVENTMCFREIHCFRWRNRRRLGWRSGGIRLNMYATRSSGADNSNVDVTRGEPKWQYTYRLFLLISVIYWRWSSLCIIIYKRGCNLKLQLRLHVHNCATMRWDLGGNTNMTNSNLH